MGSKLVGAFKALFPDDPVGLPTETSWENRLQEAAYTSPSGSRVPFYYEDVSREIELRNAAFDFPGVDESYIQQNGFASKRFPLRIFFWGANHDLVANEFDKALLQPGVGKLEHPVYGEHYVVPFGTITRRDDLKSAANQTIFEVSFLKTLLDLYPLVSTSPKSALLDQLDIFNLNAAGQFSVSTKLATAASKGNAIATIRDGIGKASASLSAVAAVNRAANDDFRDAQDALNFGIDTLIGQPLLLAQQMINMVTAPARALAAIGDRLAAYNAFFDSQIASRAGSSENDDVSLSTRKLQASNDFHIADLYVMAAVSGSSLAVVNHTFSTKPEAISAAVVILDQLDEIVAWREARFESLGESDTGEAIESLQKAVALVAAYLVEISFQLVPERRVVLDRARSIVDLCAELYGSVDDKLDLLIASNSLTGSEILELPRGRVIAYYP